MSETASRTSVTSPDESVLRSGMRMSADERRRAVLAAAVHEFAVAGFAGTSTATIATKAGISQPYLFRLFPTKLDLYLAAVGAGFDSITEAFAEASEGLGGEAALEAMARRYMSLIADRDLLTLQLHSYASTEDPAVRRFVAGRFAALADYVEERTGASGQLLHTFFASGMLCTVVASLSDGPIDPGLVRLLGGGIDKKFEDVAVTFDCAPPSD